jgi:hypothetical protein
MYKQYPLYHRTTAQNVQTISLTSHNNSTNWTSNISYVIEQQHKMYKQYLLHHITTAQNVQTISLTSHNNSTNCTNNIPYIIEHHHKLINKCLYIIEQLNKENQYPSCYRKTQNGQVISLVFWNKNTKWRSNIPYIIEQGQMFERYPLCHKTKWANNIQLMTFDEVNTRIDQHMEHDIHRGMMAPSEVNIMFHGLINPCIHRNWKSLLFYFIILYVFIFPICLC